MGQEPKSLEDIQRSWDQCGTKEVDQRYERFAYEGRRRSIIYKWLEQACGIPDAKIVDIGCGYGSLTKHAALRAKVYGLDLNAQYLSGAAEKRLIPIVCNIARTLPCKSGSIDVVVAGEVIEHVLNPEEFLTECRRIMKPGGRLIITTPNLRSLLSIIYIVFRGLPCPAVFQPVHVRFFTFRSLKKLLEGLGFSVTASRTNEVLPGFVTRYVPLVGIPITKVFDLLNIFLNRPLRELGF